MVSVAVVSVAVVSVAVVSAGAEVKKAGLPAEIKNATKQLKNAEAARTALIINMAVDKAHATINKKKKHSEGRRRWRRPRRPRGAPSLSR